MNRKAKAKKALEAEIAERVATVNDCPVCKTRFFSVLSREAHYKLYPAHKEKVC